MAKGWLQCVPAQSRHDAWARSARVLGEGDLALINTDYALDAKLNPVRDALVIEDKHLLDVK